MKERKVFSRRSFLRLSTLAGTGALSARSLMAQTKKRPNIVFVMADDLGWADVGFNRTEFYETPNIDKFCASGMNFTSAYPGAANCMPSRSCIMTGMYTPRTQMWTPGMKAKGKFVYMKFLVPNKNNKKGNKVFPSLGALDPKVTSLAKVLKSAGYKTAHFGKWHLWPDGQGFDINDTNGKGAELGKKFYGNIDVHEWLTHAAVKFIEKNKDNPFFVYLTHWDVHTPIRARKNIVAKYKQKKSSLAGAKLPSDQPVDGKSFVPLLHGKKALENRSIFWHYPLYLEGKDHGAVVPIHTTSRKYWRATPCSTIRKGDWKLIEYFESNSVELFNLKDDISEKKELSKKYPEKAEELLKELKKWQKDTKAVIPHLPSYLFLHESSDQTGLFIADFTFAILHHRI